jgi:hypothetical protein
VKLAKAGERSPANPGREALGIALTDAIMRAVSPLIDGQPTDLVIEAMAAAWIGALIAGTPRRDDRLKVLARYGNAVIDFADRV